MLQLLRGKKAGWVVKIACVLITIGFSFFGIEGYFVSRTNTSVATVGKTEITQDQFRDRFNQFRQRMQQMMGGNANAAYFENPEIKQHVLDQLVNEQVILAANAKLGITIPASRIRQEILTIPAFQNDGTFDPDQYRMVLSSQGRTPESFEQMVRDDLATRELPTQVASTALVTDAEVDDWLRLRDERRDFRYVKLDKPAPDNTDVSDKEIGDYYKAHADDFMVPARVSLDYIELDEAKLDVDTKPDDSVLKERYAKEKSRFVSAEQRLASHILIKVDGKGTPAEQKVALAKAEAIAKDAKAGKNFADLAKQDSDDLGSKNLGGDLGWLDKGTTNDAFEDALWALNKGDISDPVLTPDGYEVIELRDIRPGKTRSFDEVKSDLAKEYAASERDRVYAEKAGKLTDLTYQDPSSLAPAAKELGLVVEKTPLFSAQGGTGIAANPAVIKAAFSDAVKVQNNNSDPIDLGPNHIAVVRIAEQKPKTPIPLDEVRDKVRGDIIAKRVANLAKTNADKLLADLDEGATLDQWATAHKLKVEDQKNIGRDAANVDSALVKAAFAMARPQAGKADNQVVALGADNYAVIQLENVVDGDPSKLDAKTREAARTTLRQNIGTSAATEFVNALRKDTKIEIFQNKLQDL